MTKKRKTVLLVLAACVLFGLLYATTYIPRKLITIDPASISKIEIFDGTRGESRTITAAEDLDHIIALSLIHIYSVFATVNAVDPGVKGQVFPSGHVVVKSVRGKDKADLPAGFPAGDIPAQDLDPTRVGLQQAEQDSDCGSLAGTCLLYTSRCV